MERVSVLTVVGTEPLTVGALMSALRITSPAQDDYLSNLPMMAREAVELFTGRAIIKKTMRLSLDLEDLDTHRDKWWTGVRQGSLNTLFRTNAIKIPSPPLISVEAINTVWTRPIKTSMDVWSCAMVSTGQCRCASQTQ